MKALVKKLFVARGDIYHANTLVDIDECQPEMILAIDRGWMEVVENVPEKEAASDGENNKRPETDNHRAEGRKARNY